MTENLSLEEKYIIAEWRKLPEWGSLEAEKANGKLFEVRRTANSRYTEPDMV